MHHQTEKIASRTRTYRKLHRTVAVPLFVFMFIIGLTGVLLGWKKQAQLTPPTESGSQNLATHWISIDSIQSIATAFSKDSLHFTTEIDRIDIRPSKGVGKVSFVRNYTELQIDLGTGKVLSVNQRYNDLVEQIHDGSIIDRIFGFDSEPVKTTYTTITSLALMLLAMSGFWMWNNPRRMRKIKSADQA